MEIPIDRLQTEYAYQLFYEEEDSKHEKDKNKGMDMKDQGQTIITEKKEPKTYQ